MWYISRHGNQKTFIQIQTFLLSAWFGEQKLLLFSADVTEFCSLYFSSVEDDIFSSYQCPVLYFGKREISVFFIRIQTFLCLHLIWAEKKCSLFSSDVNLKEFCSLCFSSVEFIMFSVGINALCCISRDAKFQMFYPNSDLFVVCIKRWTKRTNVFFSPDVKEFCCLYFCSLFTPALGYYFQ